MIDVLKRAFMAAIAAGLVTLGLPRQTPPSYARAGATSAGAALDAAPAQAILGLGGAIAELEGFSPDTVEPVEQVLVVDIEAAAERSPGETVSTRGIAGAFGGDRWGQDERPAPAGSQEAVLPVARRSASPAAASRRVQPRDPAPGGKLGELFALTNRDRARRGVHLFAYRDELARVAQKRAEDMVSHHFFSHYDPGGAPGTKGALCYIEYFTRRGVTDVSMSGENVGYEAGASDPAAELNTAFMNSPEHKANILRVKFTEIGLGIATSTESASYRLDGSRVTLPAGTVFVSEVFGQFR